MYLDVLKLKDSLFIEIIWSSICQGSMNIRDRSLNSYKDHMQEIIIQNGNI